MSKLYKIIFVLEFLILFGTILPKLASASDGVTYLKSTTLVNHKCTAASLLMPDGNYPILLGCQGIVYPVDQPDATFFFYVLWSTPLDGSNPIRLGELGRGRDTYKTSKAFSGLFVTTEDISNPREPTGRVVMQGRVIDYTTLNPGFTPTPTIEGEPAEVITPTPIQSSSSKVISTFRRAGLVAALGIIALIILVFVITRPR